MPKTITPVKVLADLITSTGERFDGLLPLTITIEDGMLTLGTLNGPDMWRDKLKNLKKPKKPTGEE